MEVVKTKILTDLPVFETDHNMQDIIDLFESTDHSHLAIIDPSTGKFLGCLREDDLPMFNPRSNISDYLAYLDHIKVSPEITWFDLLERFAQNDANLIPVVDLENRVNGYFQLNDVIMTLINTPFFNEHGGVIVVAKGIRDYSFSEIAQIVESNNAKLLGAFISDNSGDVAQITLKIASDGINEIMQTFRRFNYEIVFGNSDDVFLENLKDRSNYLNKYLNV